MSKCLFNSITCQQIYVVKWSDKFIIIIIINNIIYYCQIPQRKSIDFECVICPVRENDYFTIIKSTVAFKT